MLDTSVLLRFFVAHDDPVQAGADRLREAFRRGETAIMLLDLSIYELVNIQTRRLGMPGPDVVANIEALFDMGAPICFIGRSLARSTASISSETGLSGYDAAFVAAARSLAVPLVTADQAILQRAPDHAVDLAVFAEMSAPEE